MKLIKVRNISEMLLNDATFRFRGALQKARIQLQVIGYNCGG